MGSTFICSYCGLTCFGNPRVKNQKYCSNKECQQARMRIWKKKQYNTNNSYKEKSLASQKQWRKRYPSDQYQSAYRQAHPDYVLRNRDLQRIRNRRRPSSRSTFMVMSNALLLQPMEGGLYTLTKVKKNLIVNRNALTLQRSTNGTFALIKVKRAKIVNRNALISQYN